MYASLIMLMLVPIENNSDSNQKTSSSGNDDYKPIDNSTISTPTASSPDVSAASPANSTPDAQIHDIPSTAAPEHHSDSSAEHAPIPSIPEKKKKHGLKFKVFIAIVVLLVGGLITRAYFLGKGHQKIVYKMPPPLPINLPSQAIVVANCVEGRGKQYILPKDIPLGPVYDVNNDRVIAVEYNFKASDLFVNGNKLSDTLVPFFKGNYKTEHFIITPGKLQAGQNQADTPVNVAIFVVKKPEAEAIKCD